VVLYLPASPCISLYLPASPCISLQEYERKWSKCIVSNGVLKLVFKPDNDEEGLQVQRDMGRCGEV
jgi:hypothetical protein